jgi:hypothetical protein
LSLVLITDDILAQHHVLVPSDNDFQREARLRQGLWREKEGLPIGEHRGRPLGSRLAMPFAQDTLANYLTGNIKGVVRAEVQKTEKLYRRPRIFNDLLSSQPLCLNVFAELHLDLELASNVFQRLLDKTVNVTGIEFEHSPGRGDPRFTEDGSAFDVFVSYEVGGTKGFIGIEVKYVENLDVDEARHRDRYDEITRDMNIFVPSSLPTLRVRPLEQFWRDHLLACSLLLDRASGFDHGAFVVLYPNGNRIVESAVTRYRSCLLDATTFTSWTLEHVLDALDQAGAGSWATEVRQRYLGS